MKKSNKKFELKVESYGIYTHWEKSSRELPEIIKFTHEIPAAPNIEFGMVLRIGKGKGLKMHFIISHPPFMDKNGNPTPHFVGEQIISDNNYLFFVGDSILEPLNDKKGEWTIRIFIKNNLIVTKRFIVQ